MSEVAHAGLGSGGHDTGKTVQNHGDNAVIVSLNIHQRQEQIGSGTVKTNTSQQQKGEAGSVHPYNSSNLGG